MEKIPMRSDSKKERITHSVCVGGPMTLHTIDGVIRRVRPIVLTDDDPAGWVIKARGKEYTPQRKTTMSLLGYCERDKTYAYDRLKYPMIREDFVETPDGKNRNTENRGKSGYRRASWDEALSLVAREIKRLQKTYGKETITACTSSHHSWGLVGYKISLFKRFFSMMGYTRIADNPDSWEGFHWGTPHSYGYYWRLGGPEPYDMLEMAMQNTETIVCWSTDPDTSRGGYSAQESALWRWWMKEMGIQFIYIDPFNNYTSVKHADKWIGPRMGTDAALLEAIAYVWITEDTYDKEYIAKHAYGFDKFEDYVLGREDGIPKTPAWASEKCGVKEWTIKALARDWAKKTASIIHGNGGCYIRGPYASEPARLEVMLLGMRGVGKPGVHQAKMIEWSLWNRDYPVPFQGQFVPKITVIGDPLRPVDGDVDPSINMGRYVLTDAQKQRAPELIKLFTQLPAPKQFIPRCCIHKAIIEGHAEWRGLQCFSSSQQPDANNYRKPTQQYQFEEMKYPRDGMSRVHMIWTDAPCQVTCWNDGNLTMRAYQDPSIECIVAQHPWLENDCYFADIIFPVVTKHEMNDLGNDMSSGAFTSIYLEHPCCPPVGESLSDFDVCAKVAEKLGPEYYDAYTDHMSEEERVRFFYKATGCEDYMTWEEFQKRKIFVVPCKTQEELDQIPAGLYNFYKDPENNPLSTPTGKLEYYSTEIAKYTPDDPERPPVPHWIEKSESHDERLSSKRAEKYPLLCMSNHGRWRMHAQCDDIIWNREVETMKIRGKDGYQYEPCWMHTSEAEKRGIRHGDIVKVYNERGMVLCGAYVTERVMPSVCYVDHGSRLDPIIPGYLDRGGAINTITPASTTSKNATGMAVSGFLAQVEKVTDEEMEQWKRDYPEAFARKVDPDAGVCLAGWLVDEKEAE